MMRPDIQGTHRRGGLCARLWEQAGCVVVRQE